MTYDPCPPDHDVLDAANAFSELALGPVGDWVIANAHNIEGLSDFALRTIRKARAAYDDDCPRCGDRGEHECDSIRFPHYESS